MCILVNSFNDYCPQENSIIFSQRIYSLNSNLFSKLFTFEKIYLSDDKITIACIIRRVFWLNIGLMINLQWLELFQKQVYFFFIVFINTCISSTSHIGIFLIIIFLQKFYAAFDTIKHMFLVIQSMANLFSTSTSTVSLCFASAK